MSDNYSIRLEHYFEPVGVLSVGIYQNVIENLRTLSVISADEFGYGDDPELGSYMFQVPQNISVAKRLRGIEFQYSQALTFLPGVLSGINVTSNYSRNYANERRPGTAPHKLSGGIGFKYQRLNLRVNYVWTADTPFTAAAQRYRKERTLLDLNGGYQITKAVSAYFQVRNVANVPLSLYDRFEGQPDLLVQSERYGAIWTLGLKGTF